MLISLVQVLEQNFSHLYSFIFLHTSLNVTI